MHADMRHAVERRPRRERLGGTRVSFAPSFSSTSGEKLVDAHAVEHVFQPRLVAVGAVAEIDEDAHDGVGDLASHPPA